MALTADQIVALALEAAHSPGKIAQAQSFLNAILAQVAQIYDLAAARGQFVFNFNPSLAAPLSAFLPRIPSNTFGSGPYVMPADYLRLSGSSGSTGAQRSYIWYLDGVPYPVIPVDLAEFDMQVQQAGLNSYVWLAASDMSTPIDDRILLQTTGNLTAGDTLVINLADPTRLLGGSLLGVSGQGIVPGTMVVSVAANTAVLSGPRS